MTLPVPAIVEPEVYAAVQEQRRDSQHHARPYRRGAHYLRQGLVSCPGGGSAYDGKGISPKAANGRPRDEASDRCRGTDASRFGGARVCRQMQVRTDLWDRAGWREVRALLEHPDRLTEAYRRRLHSPGHARPHDLTTVEGQWGRLRQGLARLIDSDAEGLMEKCEFEPRSTHVRQRVTKLEEQAPQRAEETAWHTARQLIVGRLEDFAAPVKDGLEEADWTRRRALIRARVKRVEVDDDQVPVIFRVDPRPGDPSPETKSLPLWRGSNNPSLRCSQ